jgi:hypothetical protein
VPDDRALPDVSVRFVLAGDDLDPASVTARLGVPPTRAHARGDVRHGDARWRTGHWAVRTDVIQTIDVVGLTRGILARLDKARDRIRTAMKDYDVRAELQVAVTPASTLTPVANFPADIVAWVASIGASIDVDVMLWAEDDDLGRWRPPDT